MNEITPMELEKFIRQCKDNPSLLADPSLAFFRDYVESLGGKLPPAAYKFEEEPEIKDNDPQQVTEESRDRDAAQAVKAQAMEILSQGKLDEAIEHLTKAITLHPTSANMYASRASVFIKMKKPNEAIRDASAAIKINPDAAKGYKSRGIARAMLGQWVEAAEDLHVASMLDHDEDINAALKECYSNLEARYTYTKLGPEVLKDARKGAVQYVMKEYEKPLETYQEGLKHDDGASCVQFSLHLPQDLITTILLHLPVKLLRKFKCVCGRWFTLITSPKFIKSHFDHSLKAINSYNHQLLFTGGREGDSGIMRHCSLFDALHNPSGVEYPPIQYPSGSRTQIVSIISVVNGLVCLLSGGVVYIWNPVLQQSKQVPLSGCSIAGGKLAFGYDEATDDYKIIQVFDTQIYVYSLRSDSWMMVEGFNDRVLGPGVYANGKIFWVVYWGSPRDGDMCRIVSIDMKNYRCEQVQVPFYKVNDYTCGISLLGGSLSVVYSARKIWVTDLWVMDKNGIEESWSKVFSLPCDLIVQPAAELDLRYNFRDVVCILGDGEIVFRSHSEQLLTVYCPKKKTFRNIDFPFSQSTLYVESLVPVLSPEEQREVEKREAFAKKRKALAQMEKEAGNAAYEEKDFDTAIDHYTKALELVTEFDKKDIFFMTNRRADSYFENRQYEECIKDCDKVAEKGGLYSYEIEMVVSALNRKGSALVKMAKCSKDYKPAIESFEKAWTYRCDMGTLDLKLSAKHAMEKLEQQEVADGEREKGNQSFKEKNFQEAIKHYTESLKGNPKDPRSYSNRAACYTKLGLLREGLNDAEKCIELDPEFVEGYTRKGAVEYLMKEYKKALETYQEGLKHDANNEELLGGVRSCVQQVSIQG